MNRHGITRKDERTPDYLAAFSRSDSPDSPDLVAVTFVTSANTIPSMEIELNELVEGAFTLTDSERRVLISSLPPRDPLESVRHS